MKLCRRSGVLPGVWRTVALVIGIWAVLAGGYGVAAANDDNDQSGRRFFDSVQQRLVADGFDPAFIQQLYAREQVFFETRGITQYFQHRESKVNYESMLHPRLIEEGRQYMRTHAETFSAARSAFEVPPELITAVILVETKFGRYLGNKAVINTLSTMAALTEHDSRDYLWSHIPAQGRFERAEYERKAGQKATWAYKELKAFLTYARDHQIDPAAVIGSFAGAMGIAQFMPSNIAAFGRDGDGDGRVDLFVAADAIHSIASYLSHYGWKPGLTRDEAFKVVYHYNHSSYYVNTILKIMDLLAG